MYFALLLSIGISFCYAEQNLISTFIIYRHGNRTPVEPFPNSRYKTWKEGLGALTNLGKQYEYFLGEALKSRYIGKLNFINRSYTPENVYIRSSNSDRCLKSAETQLAGMFPPNGSEIWNQNIMWQPIPVHSVRESSDYLLRSFEANCSKRDKIFQLFYKKLKKDKYMIKQKSFFKFLSEKTGMEVTAENSWSIYDELLIEKKLNKTLPTWLNSSVFDTLKETNLYLVNYLYLPDNKELKMSMSGYLLYYFIKNMEYHKELYYHKKFKNMIFVADTSNTIVLPQRFQLYSAHDATLWALFGALNMKLKEDIPFSACVALELWAGNKDNAYIKMYYRNSSGKFLQLTIPNCSADCTLENFKKVYSSILVDDPHTFCNQILNPNYYKKLSLGLGILSAVFFVLIIVLIFNYCNKNQKISESILD